MKRNIAAQCPYQYGVAVYQARLLLSFVDSLEYYNGCENYNVNGGNLKTTAEDKENISDKIVFNVFPNPAKDLLTVINASGENAFIEIYDFIGKRIISQEITDYSNNIIIKDLNAGIFMYRITSNNKIVKTDKFIVIK
jgi:hypothetical protein